MEGFLQTIQGLLPLVLLIVLGFAIYVAQKYLGLIDERIAKEIGADNWAMLKDLARTLILAAEQHPDLAKAIGPEKKAFVRRRVIEMAKGLGLPFSDEQIDVVIEGVLKSIKTENTNTILTELLTPEG